MSREFHIGDILSITTERLVSPRLIDGVYDILNYMTQDNLYTHQLPRASRECRPFLIAQLPELAKISADGVDAHDWKQWLSNIVDAYGEMHPVQPIPLTAHEVRDPLSELVGMVGKDTA